MDVMQRLQQVAGSLPPSEEKVCQVILAHPEFVEWTSISRLAEEAETSVSAVQRLCQTLGFRGYKEFRYELVGYLGSDEHGTAATDAVAALAASLSEATGQLANCDRTLLDDLARDIIGASTVYCLGVHRSGLVAEKLRMNLEDLGIVSISSRETVHSRHLIHSIREDACVILFSVSGGAVMFREILGDDSLDVRSTWAITFNNDSWVAQHVNRSVELPRPLASKRAAMDEHAVMMAYVEIVTLAVRKRLRA